MSYVLSGAVFMLMVSIGMSLKMSQLASNWKSLDLESVDTSLAGYVHHSAGGCTCAGPYSALDPV